MQSKKTSPGLTMLTITVGFLFLYILTRSDIVFYASFIIGCIGVFSDYLSRKIDFIWMKLAILLGKFIPNITLILIFYFFLFPIALLSKFFGKEKPLWIKNDRGTTFTDLSMEFDIHFFKKPW